MAQIKVHCYAGSKPEQSKPFNIEETAKFSAVRKQLTDAGFIPPDDPSNNVGYRFIIYNSANTNPQDTIMPFMVEDFADFKSALGPGNQLILTNHFATKKPDLMGIGVDWWFNRFVGINCNLNMSDPTAKEQNDKIKAFKPMMLTSVKPTSQNVIGVYDNVCVCVKGTVVEFGINSWGSAGFEFSITPTKGEAIADGGLYIPYSGEKDHYASTGLRRYYKTANTIQIMGTEQLNIPNGESISYQRVSFKTRRITSFKLNGKTHSSNTTPPALHGVSKFSEDEDDNESRVLNGMRNHQAIANAGSLQVIPGDGIQPGTVTQGGGSQQEFGGAGISDIKVDDWSQALGEVVVYFFVFKTHEDAVKTIQGYNAPNPNIWND